MECIEVPDEENNENVKLITVSDNEGKSSRMKKKDREG